MSSATRPPPQHVAIIMDGNGRWASKRGWPRLVGHRKGAERIKEVVRAAPDLGIRWMTVYAFSTENWKRSRDEVLGLMGLFYRYIDREAEKLNQEGVRLRFIGDRRPLNEQLRALMGRIEARTAHNTRLNLVVGINYGGRDELLRATRDLAERAARGELAPDAIDDVVLTDALDTAGMPEPDLVIRTSGESRVSNFLLWQAAYAEYVFTPTLWPDFTPQHLSDILDQYSGRDRRFGGVKA